MNFDIPKWLQVLFLIAGVGGTGFVFWISGGAPDLNFSWEEIQKIINIFVSVKQSGN